MRDNKLILPIALIGGSLAGYAINPLSNHIINKAVINKLSRKVDEFKETLTPRQFVMYTRIIKRTEDLSSFSKHTNEFENIKTELYSLKDELTKSLSRDQMKLFTEIENLQITLSERVGYTTKATIALGGIIAMSIAHLNKKN